MSAADVTPEVVAALRKQYPPEMYSRNRSHQPVGSHASAVLDLWDVLDALESAWADRDALRTQVEAMQAQVERFKTGAVRVSLDGKVYFEPYVQALRNEVDALRAQLAARAVEVPEPSDIDAAWNEYATLNSAMLSDDPEDDLEVFSAGFRAGAAWSLPAPAPDTVTRYEWIPFEERLPEDGQSAAFVTKCERDPFYHGRVLGGRYTAGEFGGFSIPGRMSEASHWPPLPPAPPANEGRG